MKGATSEEYKKEKYGGVTATGKVKLEDCQFLNMGNVTTILFLKKLLNDQKELLEANGVVTTTTLASLTSAFQIAVDKDGNKYVLRNSSHECDGKVAGFLRVAKKLSLLANNCVGFGCPDFLPTIDGKFHPAEVCFLESPSEVMDDIKVVSKEVDSDEAKYDRIRDEEQKKRLVRKRKPRGLADAGVPKVTRKLGFGDDDAEDDSGVTRTLSFF